MPQRNGASGDAQGRTGQEQPPDADGQENDVEQATSWMASTAIRAGLTLVGIVLLLFALGQAVGLPLLELVTEALTSQTGQWLVVAFFAILLIGAAQRGVPSS
jgi:hypothetical protein